jgi:hypothetical protein
MAGCEGGSFNRCRFARDGSAELFTTVNRRGEAHILHWEQVCCHSAKHTSVLEPAAQ